MIENEGVWIAGTVDTKAEELVYVCECLATAGVSATIVDLSTSQSSTKVDLRAY